MKKSICIIMALAMFGACDDDEDEVTPIGADGDTVVFVADFNAFTPFERIFISADVVTVIGDGAFEASLAIAGDDPGSIRPWRIRNGSCADSGSSVGGSGSYPDVVIGTDGTGSVSTVVRNTLDPNDFQHVEVYLSPDQTDQDTDLLACGDLILQ
ncbi:MAG: hypothetical protein SFX73_24645 [Kofleriaceae bacterium]|nr:hypothetical protein [Kofleriaceae bacterium]